MSKVRSTMALSMGILMLSAIVFASSASAEWMVGGTALSGSAPLAKTAKTDESAKLKAAGVTIECTGETLNGVSPEIIAPAGGAASSLEFTKCSANESCKVQTTISTVPLDATVTLDASNSSAAEATFLPKTKSTFATIKFEGEKCALLGTQPVTGKAKVLAPTGRVENTLQLIEAKVTLGSGELKVGSSGAELTGAALLKLESGKTWSFL